jgi:hypothetical protein
MSLGKGKVGAWAREVGHDEGAEQFSPVVVVARPVGSCSLPVGKEGPDLIRW